MGSERLMMKKLEVFFDYSCPYCLKGYYYLVELLPEYPELEVVWRLCEAHPRPEEGFGKHTDLCIQGAFFAAQKGVDMMAYHEKMFTFYHIDRADVEDANVLAQALSDLLDAGEFAEALSGGRYAKDLKAANAYAFEQSGVWVIPAFRMDGKKLDAAAGVGVTKEQLREFLNMSRQTAG